jgi:trk system potassium uptake protein TrkH
MSGFTTTGSSVATDVAALPVSIAIWRQLTVWLGGVGVVALGVAILPRLRVGGRQMLQSELAGPDVDGFSTRVRDTVRQFWLAYLGLTAIGFLALALPGWLGRTDAMDSFQAFAHALTTIGTGGFSTEPESIGAFGSLTQWTVIVFMIVAGANLLVLYRSLAKRRPGLAAADEEHRLYVAILVVAGALLTLLVLADGPLAGTDAFTAAVFEATSVVTTTGYFVTDYSTWSTLALMTMALLFFVGGCSGSTAGSIKIVRHLLIGRALRRDLERTVRPELVRVTRLGGAVVDPQVLSAVTSFVLLYTAVFVVGTGLLGLDALVNDTGATALELIFASASSLGNSGVGLGPAGPTGSFGTYNDGSTFTMTLLMWVGRLEIVPILVLLSRRYWRV